MNVPPRPAATAPSTASSARRCSPTSTATTARLEIVAAGMDRHVYAWHADGTPVAGFPVLVVDRSKIAAVDPQTHASTFNADAGADQQGAIVDTPAVGDLDDGDAREAGDRRRHERGVRRRQTAASTRRPRTAPRSTCSTSSGRHRRFKIGVRRAATTSRAAARPATRASTRSTPTATPTRAAEPFLPGWPEKVGDHPDRAAAGGRRGHHRLPGDRPGRLPHRRQRAQGRRDRRHRPRLHLQPRRPVLLRPDGAASDNAAADRLRDRRQQVDTPDDPGGRPSRLRRPRRRRARRSWRRPPG